MPADTPLLALRSAGLEVHDARVDPRPGFWEPFGVLWHHTGTASPPKPGQPVSLHVCQHGRADLPGPLCQWLIGGDGQWWWVTDGRANHAGRGDLDVWHWVIGGANRPPNPPQPDDNHDTLDGNAHLIGVEVEGTGDWSAEVYHSVLIGTQTLLSYYQQPRDTLLAHKEWTARKPDPRNIDMPMSREWLRAQAPNPSPIPPIGDDMLKVVECREHPGPQFLTNGIDSVKTLSPEALTHGKNLGFYPAEVVSVPHDWIAWVDQAQDGHHNPETP